MTRRRRWPLAVAAAVAVPVLATAGCSSHSSGASQGSAPASSSSPAATSSGAASGSPSSGDQLQQMEKKVDAAQSAADAADRDAQSN